MAVSIVSAIIGRSITMAIGTTMIIIETPASDDSARRDHRAGKVKASCAAKKAWRDHRHVVLTWG